MDFERELEAEASLEVGDSGAVAPEGATASPLKGAAGKVSYAIRINIKEMIDEWGIDSVGFLTLTVGDACPVYGFKQVFDAKEASRRFNSLRSHLLVDLFEKAVVVRERHKNGALHYHLVGVLKGGLNIRRGFDWAEVKRRDYRSVCPDLRAIWKMLRERLPEFGFGRSELTPIRTTGAQIASYVSKYVSKNLENRRPEDKGKRLVTYIGWDKEHLKPSDFGWASKPACQWRAKARQAAAVLGCYTPEDCKERWGSKWAWILTECWSRCCGNARGWELDFSAGKREVLWFYLMKFAGLVRIPTRAPKIDGETVNDARWFFDHRQGVGSGVGGGVPGLNCLREIDAKMGSNWHTLTPSAPPGGRGKDTPCVFSM